MKDHDTRSSRPAFADAAASVSASTFGARRLPEIKGLYVATIGGSSRKTSPKANENQYKSGGHKASNRHLRRRATSHLSRKRHRYPSAAARKQRDASQQPSSCRRSRRKRVRLQSEHSTWQQQSIGDEKDDKSSSSLHWVTTHLWHAKRFHLKTLWGWRIPMAHTNRGPSASLRLARNHALIQDITWAGQALVVSCAEMEPPVGAMHRMCPNFLPANASSRASLLSGNSLGEGVVHEPDRFPLGPIGPASWWITSTAANQTKVWTIYIWTHPSIISQLETTLGNMFESARDVSIEGPVRNPLARLQIRGANATVAVRRALSPTSADTVKSERFCYDWDLLKAGASLHSQLPHGTILCVKTHLGSDSGVIEPKANEDGFLAHVETIQRNLSEFNPLVDRPPLWPLVATNQILLVSQCPCENSAAPQNAGVQGWDILCHPSCSKELFLALTNKGGAVAIGLADETHARMESEPPLPVFPRDFPDTAEGRRYWNHEDRDWSVFRRCIESERVVTSDSCTKDETSTMPKVDWSFALDDGSATERREPIVVVRGEFGIPFLNALSTNVQVEDQRGERSERKRRPRRSVPCGIVKHSPLSADKAKEHRDMCKMLLESLTLPAFIRCHILVQDRGTINPGNYIYSPSGSPPFTLGVSVGGAFSQAYGRSHGVGFLSATKLLCLLSEVRQDCVSVVVTRPTGKRQVELKVKVGQDGDGEKFASATACLLL